MKISDNLRGHIPQVEAPTAYHDPATGLRGWKVKIPGDRPLATPAVAGGRVFLGGGFGSYDFYAFAADTGRVIWQYQTEDDGPTAAVVAEERVVFNTESCELEVLNIDGERMWKKWLGDPLMSMPAVHDGRVYMVYPDSRGDRRHYLACFALSDGAELWRTPLAGEVITCPVLAEGHAYLSTLGGILACFRLDNGARLWEEDKSATSSPSVWRQQCYFSQRSQRHSQRRARAQQTEHVATKVAAAGTPRDAFNSTSTDADYLDYQERSHRSPMFNKYSTYDASVGFAHSKGDGKLNQAMYNLGHGHVSGIWAYQGSRPFLSGGRLFSGVGDTIHCVDSDSKAEHWKTRLREGGNPEDIIDNYLTPPAIVNDKVFTATMDGRVFCMAADSGEVLWQVNLGEPVCFQPAVAQGRVFVPTATCHLYCLETGDAGDDGWLMWGGTAQHNGVLD